MEKIASCDTCVYFNSKDKNSTLRPETAVFRYRLEERYWKIGSEIHTLFAEIYERNGACQRFPKKEYVDNQYVCGEYKPVK